MIFLPKIHILHKPGALVTALVGLGIAVAAFLFTVISSRVSFGKDFKGN